MIELSEIWNKRFIEEAKNKANWSKDTSTKHGCILVDPKTKSILASGYNGFVRGIDDNIKERYERPLKYVYTEHAERNMLYNCTRRGISTDGMYVYVTGKSCTDCCRGLIQSGIAAIFIDKDSIGTDFDIRWKENTDISLSMFNEVGIPVFYI